ncbi:MULTISPECIES: CDP-diacylglycerol diphosphatase [Dickeya]|uniref:CDP-diacylglycerol pyrophosphatase n=1 Tax=Dickeya aquatica TaxID=1401087 RepID=A0A375A8X8_9GAMM|nr:MULTISPECIES: CDP-diacylglycerol diphosphatase [Dickeya]SLM62534.1 CDP-diacylglycerol pyrophosphatase [Dickeya aquatica]
MMRALRHKTYLCGLLLCVLLLALILAIWRPFTRRGNDNALWMIVSQQCVPHQQQSGAPAPCLDVDIAGGYALLKDRRGPYHNLLIATARMSGIESPHLLQADTPNYFAAAWQYRNRLSHQHGSPIQDDNIGLAINSYYGRTQNQLHIHTACLNPQVYQILQTQAATLTPDWQPLNEPLAGHTYLAMKLTGKTPDNVAPFMLLNQYAQQHHDTLDNYGLALTVNAQGDVIILAVRRDLFGLMNLGSAEEVLDLNCVLAK